MEQDFIRSSESELEMATRLSRIISRAGTGRAAGRRPQTFHDAHASSYQLAAAAAATPATATTPAATPETSTTSITSTSSSVGGIPFHTEESSRGILDSCPFGSHVPSTPRSDAADLDGVSGVKPFGEIPGPKGWPLLGTLGTYLFGRGLERIYDHQVRGDISHLFYT